MFDFIEKTYDFSIVRKKIACRKSRVKFSGNIFLRFLDFSDNSDSENRVFEKNFLGQKYFQKNPDLEGASIGRALITFFGDRQLIFSGWD